MLTQYNALEEKRLIVGVSLVIISLIGLFPYVLLPLVTAGKHCSVTAFGGGMITSMLRPFGLIASFFCYISLVTGLFPSKSEHGRFRLQWMNNLINKSWWSFIAVTLCGSVLGGMVWISQIDSYYCLMPDNILIRNSMFAKGTLHDWDEVQKVEAKCGSTKNGSFGGLTIFVGDEQLWVSLGKGDRINALKYVAIHDALQKHNLHYDVVGDSSVQERECPRDVFQLFSGRF